MCLEEGKGHKTGRTLSKRVQGGAPSGTENRRLGSRGPSRHPCQELPPSTAGCLITARESNQATRREANDRIWKQTHLPGARRSRSCEGSIWRREIFVGSNHHLDTIDGPSEGIIGVRLSQDGSGCRNRGQAVGNKRGSRQISKKATSVIQAKDSHGFSEAAAMRC